MRAPSLALPPAQEAPIVVAMSGGVDSATTAALLQKQGHRVIGITLQLHPSVPNVNSSVSSSSSAQPRAKTCCAGRDLYDAQKTARKLGIPHYTLDFEERFQDTVVKDFLQSYRNGETPLPCVRCNQHIKFDALLEVAKELGAKALATGHYARIVHGSDNAPFLLRGIDGKKDQSYYLFATTKEQLSFLRFPLGGMTKEQTRALARELGLPSAEKAESQDICFVAKHYTDLFPELQSKTKQGEAKGGAQGDAGDKFPKGEIRGMDGALLGEHEGVAGYTIGQRKGLGLGGLSRPLYVVGIDAAENEIRVGTHEDLSVRAVRLREVNWLGEDLPRKKEEEKAEEKEEEVQVKVRSLMEPVAARLCLPLRLRLQGGSARSGEEGGGEEGGGVEVVFAEKQYGVACGQACVFYRGERVLGGGIIAQTLAASQDQSQSQAQDQAQAQSKAALEVAE